ncbi:MAG: D-cysteine desulfhydrase [Trueperaceae bacterium]|nr:D-cysteine desulfhydrase [Trueperaceae bacterium]MCO5174709.1 D-cysteine desulfhydrase [Trueperaceae bacterium]
MRLTEFPRRRYTAAATPLEPLPRLSAHLGGPNLWIKRDDLLGLAAGGNKTRKLEFLVADAIERGADTLVTTGAVQSNHCRLTLAAAVREGLACRLVLEERVANSYSPGASGNNFLFGLLGVEAVTVVPAGTDLMAEMNKVAAELAAQGRSAYIIPGGGSNTLGALGYVSCAQELMQQAFETGLRIDHLVTASGSGGTHAGVVAGLTGTGAGVPITGISVRAPKAPQEEKILGLARATAELAGARSLPTADDVVVLDDYVGAGYSLPTDGMIEAVKLFARHEGVLLDPVYTGKAAAGLIDMVRRGAFGRHENVVFLHTGGSPALYAYQDVLTD